MSGLRRWFRCLGPWRLLACLAAMAVVIAIELTIGNDKSPEADEAVLLWLGDAIPAPLGRFLVVVYQVSGTRVTALLVMASLLFLSLKRAWNDLTWLAIGTAGILLIVDQWLKPLFDRARPLGRLVEVSGRSFPSGHAAGAVVFYFLMCAILSKRYPHLRQPLYLGSTLWVALIWISTLYCRVHWFTDIVAGAAVGFIWLTICLTGWKVSLASQSERNRGIPL
ncbi:MULTISPECIES: phosphatase PAP2 family protein [Synechococcaceae]|nr:MULTISPECIES: phosphatase PAP2 family protein [Synechococcaceae]MCT4365775.1 phosphatase PAP2 family protein [Candidatus Regnicoccus frigidus MAG-AL1]MCT4366495.1 phosphatase PAP2 family protein [Candidatus Regnicoccus frigidus MAG-AL2]